MIFCSIVELIADYKYVSILLSPFFVGFGYGAHARQFFFSMIVYFGI